MKFAHTLKHYLSALGAVPIAATLLFGIASHASPPIKPPVPGTETGHGGGGDRYPGKPYIELPPITWCSKLSAMVDDAFEDEQDAEQLSGKRQALVLDIESIINAYRSDALPDQPLSYQLLLTAKAINELLPEGEGDLAADVVLKHLLRTTQSVNLAFETRHYISWRSKRHARRLLPMGPEFYTSYIGSAKAMLDMWFDFAVEGPALSVAEAKFPLPNLTVLSALNRDRWRLTVGLEILKYLHRSFNQDLFSRYFECVDALVVDKATRLDKYLKLNPAGSEKDASQRIRLVDSLSKIRESMSPHGAPNSQLWNCR